MEPILKWAGGKRQLLTELKEFVPVDDCKKARYFEPFIGGGSLCFHLELPSIIINDLNPEIVNVYLQIYHKHLQLIEELKKHSQQHSEEYYYKVRELDRKKSYSRLSAIKKAARIIYLNRTCYNGLYRVNSLGQFNVPIGKYENPDIVMEQRILALNAYFHQANVEFRNMDFAEAVVDAQAGDFIYFDPPYDYDGNGFTSYVSEGFSHTDTQRLKEVADALVEKGCIVLISNNATQFVVSLFDDPKYSIKYVNANRSINSIGDNRKNAKEVLIYGKL